MKVLIVGQGELGAALNFVLKDNPDNKIVLKGRDFQSSISQAEVILLAVPTKAVEEITKKIKDVRSNGCLLVLSKGLTKEGKTALEVVQENWPDKIALISGPMLAEELVQGKETKALISGETDQIITLFKNSNIIVKETDDLVGLSWAGPLKNIYAIGLGIAKGEDRGVNYRAVFIQEAVSEMAKIIESLGGNKETAFSIAGIGDLIATGFSHYSSNFKLGFDLARGKQWPKPTEGVMTILGLAIRFSSDKLDNYPLLGQIINRVTNL